ncbi:MAG: carboxylating nicotinate-nucleotide diphosphorylase [Nitrososphaerota archaeon]|nr:carboxylating nicotinate-nucleotide diphosphorylase [Aigarchaeota archaeon]MDW8076479.1 carboxylating nicotinate-nucleotide diphosphorylase [Nitrososphaerota archaeon]
MSLRRQLLKFLEEDLGWGDVTSELLIPEDALGKGVVIAKEPGIMCGGDEAKELADLVNLNVKVLKKDGEPFDKGEVLLELTGSVRNILSVERVLLNLLAHMCGVATHTRRIVEKVRRVNPNVRVAATRKTLPGLRFFEKKAVRIGGGDTHRYDLSSMVLIKDNHIAVLGDVRLAVERAKKLASFAIKVEVEVSNVKDALEAAKGGADIIMLDNMEPSEIKEVIKTLEAAGLRERLLIEASGGITEENVVEYATTGVDIISIGEITHSARSIDISLDVMIVKE